MFLISFRKRELKVLKQFERNSKNTKSKLEASFSRYKSIICAKSQGLKKKSLFYNY